MKRQTAMALAAVFAMSVAGTALAAPANPFVDVPAKHWAYDSINKLAQAGVISGYGDGTFKGDKTLTRYEVAVLVGKAMANSDKADAETKKTIEALKAEFGSELSNLGVRVDNLEKNASKIKFTGEVRERFNQEDKDGATNPADRTNSTTRFRLNMDAKVADNVNFHGRYQSESGWGNTANTDGTKNEAKLDQAYISGKIGEVGYSFGRQGIWLGQGLIADYDHNFDGLYLSGGKDVKVTAGAVKAGSVNFTAADINAKVTNDLSLSASYLKDDLEGNANEIKTTAFGLKYTGIKNLAITGEYGENNSTKAKASAFHTGDAAKGFMAQVKYKGANKAKVGSFGAWVGFRSGEDGFDPSDLTTLDSASVYLDNVKGTEFGVNYTVFTNGVLTLQYNDLELKDVNVGQQKDKQNFFAHLVYSF